MRQEEIDKKIGMPDVDAEWAKFEREVIGKGTASRKPLCWGLGIAASIALIAGIFLYGHDGGESQQLLAEHPVPVVEDFPVDSLPSPSPVPHSSPSSVPLPTTDLLAKAEPTQSTVTTPSPAAASETVYDCGEIQPRFPGGERALLEFIKEHLKYPDLAMEYGARGRVMMTFVVDSTGHTSDYKAIKFNLTYDTLRMNREPVERQVALKEQIQLQLGEECTRMLSKMPRWAPGNVYGKFVSMRYTIPCRFQVTDAERQAYLALRNDALQGRIAGLNIVNFSEMDSMRIGNAKRSDSILGGIDWQPVAQFSDDQIKERCKAYLLSSYRKGFVEDVDRKQFAPDLFDTTAKERLFGLLNQHQRLRQEFFGPIGSDAHGLYVPLVRDALIEVHDNAWYSEGKIVSTKINPLVDSVLNEIDQAGNMARQHLVVKDSLVRTAFIYGGQVSEGDPHQPSHCLQRWSYNLRKLKSPFYFMPDPDAPSFWWGEVYTSMTPQRRIIMHLHSVDKLYASDCPDLLGNRRMVEGTVLNEKDEPIVGATVTVGFVVGADTGGTRTDSTGHFSLWLPFHDATMTVQETGYKTVRLMHPADTVLTIRMKDMLKLKDVKVKKKTETDIPIA